MRQPIQIAPGQIWWRLVPFHSSWGHGDRDGWSLGPRVETDEYRNYEVIDGWGIGVVEVLEFLQSAQLGKLAVIRKTFADPDGALVGRHRGNRMVRKVGSVRAFLNSPARKWNLRA